MHGDDLGAAAGVGELERDRHLAAHRGIGGLELDDLLVRHELHEPAVERVIPERYHVPRDEPTPPR